MLTAYLFGQLLFGAIGLAAFVYGRKQARLKMTLIAIVLMSYGLVVSDVRLLWAVGIFLTLALFAFRD